jgi:hypothetical protein
MCYPLPENTGKNFVTCLSTIADEVARTSAVAVACSAPYKKVKVNDVEITPPSTV